MEIKSATQSDIHAVLQQMRQLRQQAQVETKNPLDQLDVTGNVNAARVSTQGPSFGQIMSDAVGSVNQLQQTASKGSEDFVLGKSNDLVKVMVDGQKASVGFQALVQVRNRMVTAYQDIMNMPI